MSWEVLQADARNLPLDDDSVDLIITSPPYWALRSYQDGGEPVPGQVGDEPSPQEYVAELVDIVDSWRRVLKPTGSLWLNLGDKYATRGWGGGDLDTGKRAAAAAPGLGPSAQTLAPYKSLLGLPWRVALGLIDRGWILRAEVIWDKPNSLPESVRDRVKRSHETFFHFTLEPLYFAAVDEIREEYLTDMAWQSNDGKRGASTRGDNARAHVHVPLTPEQKLAGKLPGSVRAVEADPDEVDPRRWRDKTDESEGTIHAGGRRLPPEPGEEHAFHPPGRLPGSVRSVTLEPLTIPKAVRETLGLVDHFAAFPQEWPRWIINGWSPRGICTACGEGRRPVRTWHGPHDQEPVRVVTPEETRRFVAGFADWASAAGVTRRDLDETCGTNGMAGHWLTAGSQPAVPTPEQWTKIVERFEDADPGLPEWLSEIVHTYELRPVRGGNFQGTFAEGGRKGGAGSAEFEHEETPTIAIAGYACSCAPRTSHVGTRGDWKEGRTPEPGKRSDDFTGQSERVPRRKPEPVAAGAFGYHLSDWEAPPTRPAVVLDPFGGTGTTAGVAHMLGRHGISVDLSADYCRLAEWRIGKSGHFAKAEQRTWAERQGTLL